jgi:hypothetical protein
MEAADAAAVSGWMDYLEGLAGALLAAARRWAEAHAGTAEGGGGGAAARAAADALPGPRLLADSLFMHDLREARARGPPQNQLGGSAGRAATDASPGLRPPARSLLHIKLRGAPARVARHGLAVGMWGALLRNARAGAQHRPRAMRSDGAERALCAGAGADHRGAGAEGTARHRQGVALWRAHHRSLPAPPGARSSMKCEFAWVRMTLCFGFVLPKGFIQQASVYYVISMFCSTKAPVRAQLELLSLWWTDALLGACHVWAERMPCTGHRQRPKDRRSNRGRRGCCGLVSGAHCCLLQLQRPRNRTCS